MHVSADHVFVSDVNAGMHKANMANQWQSMLPGMCQRQSE